MTYPVVIFWMIAIWALMSRGPAMYYLFFGSMSFDMLSVIPSGDSGVALTPPWIVAVLLILKTFNRTGPTRMIEALISPKCFLPLTLSALYGCFASILMPSLFSGHMLVFPMRATAKGYYKVALQPSNANITQSAYYVICMMTVWACYAICTSEKERTPFFKAFVFGAVVAILTGFVDIVTSTLHLGALLSPFRTASYALMDGVEMLGVRRVIGLTPEASTYAELLFGFLPILALSPIPSSYFPPMGPWRILICALLAGLCLASTSSGGVVSLLALALLMGGWSVIGLLRGRRGALGVLFIGAILATVAIGLVLFAPAVSDFATRLFDTLVLKKNLSDSYIERSSWNASAVSAFWSSYGLGVGLGSARASSYVAALLASIGAPGAACLLIFFARMAMARPPRPQDRTLASTFKLAGVAGLIIPALSVGTANFGLPNAVLFGALIALLWPNMAANRTARAARPAWNDAADPAAPNSLPAKS